MKREKERERERRERENMQSYSVMFSTLHNE